MRIQPSSTALLLSLLLLCVFLAVAPAFANNPLAVTSSGTPYRWNSFPIVYAVDGGNLGTLTNSQTNALVAQAFSAWTSVSTASLSVTQNPGISLSADGDVDTVAEFNALFPSPCLSFNAIIYDSGGALTDALFGAGASDSVLGFTSPCLAGSGDSILAFNAVFIVKPFTTSTPGALAQSQILGVFIHELGHGLGLGHSQVNVNCFVTLASCPSNAPGGDVFGVPTMFPVLLPQTETTNVSLQATLAADDISAISTLYPAPSFATSTGTISGIVFFGDGINHYQGGNVIARRVGDPRVTAVSNASGMIAQVARGNPSLLTLPSTRGSPDPTKRGQYTIPGLPPGTYTVEVESVNSSFTGGSGVGSMGQQRGEIFPLSAAAECFGGPESNSDNPAICQSLSLTAGNVLTNNNIILNDTLATMDPLDAITRNDTIGTATPVGAGTTTTASISANNGPDVDVYAINIPANQILSAEIRSRRRTPQGYLDSVLEVLNSNGVRPTTCRSGEHHSFYNEPCLNDDFISAVGPTFDSQLVYAPPSAGTAYLRVTDALGDSRPDFVYDLTVNFAPASPEFPFPPPATFFSAQFVNTISPVNSVTVVNIGSANMVLGSSPLAITNGTTPGVFALADGSTCTPNRILTPGASCSVNFTFQPTAPNSNFSGQVRVANNSSQGTEMFSLFGIGVDLSIAPASGSNSQTVTAGQAAGFAINAIPAPSGGGLPTSTTFTISGQPQGAAVSFNPASIPAGAPQGSSWVTAMTVTTTARTAALPAPKRLPMPPSSFVVLLLAGAALSLIVAAPRIHTPRWVGICACIVVLCVFASLQACGGGGGATSGSGTVNPNGTPAGTYPLTITATSGPISRTTTVTLIVQ